MLLMMQAMNNATNRSTPADNVAQNRINRRGQYDEEGEAMLIIGASSA